MKKTTKNPRFLFFLFFIVIIILLEPDGLLS